MLWLSARRTARRMKPAPFEYHRPETVDEAVELLARPRRPRARRRPEPRAADEAAPVKPRALVDVNGVAGLDAIEERGRRAARRRAGAPAACSTTSSSRAAQPLLARGGPVRRLPRDAPPRHRRRLARVRGAVGRADRGRGRARRDDRGAVARGERTIPAREFFRGPNETALEPDELLAAVRLPPAAPRQAPPSTRSAPRYRDFARSRPRRGRHARRRRRCTAPSSCCSAWRRRRYRADVSHLVGTTVDDGALDGRRRRPVGHRAARTTSRLAAPTAAGSPSSSRGAPLRDAAASAQRRPRERQRETVARRGERRRRDGRSSSRG